jgi:hypothetical protein
MDSCFRRNDRALNIRYANKNIISREKTEIKCHCGVLIVTNSSNGGAEVFSL